MAIFLIIDSDLSAVKSVKGGLEGVSEDIIAIAKTQNGDAEVKRFSEL